RRPTRSDRNGFDAQWRPSGGAPDGQGASCSIRRRDGVTRNTMPNRSQAMPTIRVLQVEDSELDAELVLAELEADGIPHEARLVDDEAGYPAALKEFDPHIVLSDLSVPGFSGQRALELLRERDEDLPFIYVSATLGEEAAIEALRKGATDYILKQNPPGWQARCVARLPKWRRARPVAGPRRSCFARSASRAWRCWPVASATTCATCCNRCCWPGTACRITRTIRAWRGWASWCATAASAASTWCIRCCRLRAARGAPSRCGWVPCSMHSSC